MFTIFFSDYVSLKMICLDITGFWWRGWHNGNIWEIHLQFLFVDTILMMPSSAVVQMQMQHVADIPTISGANGEYSAGHWPWIRNLQVATGWWFGTFFIFPYIGNNHPNWLIFFRGVQTTNQAISCMLCSSVRDGEFDAQQRLRICVRLAYSSGIFRLFRYHSSMNCLRHLKILNAGLPPNWEPQDLILLHFPQFQRKQIGHPLC